MDNFNHLEDKVARFQARESRVSAVTTQLIQTGTQDAVATAFANQYEGRWIYAHGGGWFRWTGTHWASDTTKQILHKIRELARESNPYGKAANTVGSAISLASSAIGQLDVVLENVQKQRTYFGAVSNKISHLINQKTVERLNMQASRSRILDTDYAAATSELAKRQILQQAGVAMIAQANALPQTLMMLLSD